MVDENPLSGPKPAHRRTGFFDHPYRLMAQYQRRLAPDVPRHDIAGADAAGFDPHQQIVRSDLRRWMILDADIAEVIQTRDLHHDWNFSAARRPVNLLCAYVRERPHDANLGFMARPVCPLIAVDVIIEIGGRIVLIERKNDPHGWAIPGGFVDVGERVETAAVREMREETTLEVELTDLLGSLFAARSRSARPYRQCGVCRPCAGQPARR